MYILTAKVRRSDGTYYYLVSKDGIRSIITAMQLQRVAVTGVQKGQLNPEYNKKLPEFPLEYVEGLLSGEKTDKGAIKVCRKANNTYTYRKDGHTQDGFTEGDIIRFLLEDKSCRNAYVRRGTSKLYVNNTVVLLGVRRSAEGLSYLIQLEDLTVCYLKASEVPKYVKGSGAYLLNGYIVGQQITSPELPVLTGQEQGGVGGTRGNIDTQRVGAEMDEETEIECSDKSLQEKGGGATTFETVQNILNRSRWRPSAIDRERIAQPFCSYSRRVVYPKEQVSPADYFVLIKEQETIAVGLSDKGRQERGIIVVPEEIQGVKVERIASGGFVDSKCQGVYLPDSVEYVGKKAFKETNIQECNVPLGAKIEEQAFKGCANLQNSDKMIIVNGVLFTAEYNHVFGERKACIVPNNVYTIDGEAIEGSEVVVLPPTVNDLRENALEGVQEVVFLSDQKYIRTGVLSRSRITVKITPTNRELYELLSDRYKGQADVRIELLDGMQVYTYYNYVTGENRPWYSQVNEITEIPVPKPKAQELKAPVYYTRGKADIVDKIGQGGTMSIVTEQGTVYDRILTAEPEVQIKYMNGDKIRFGHKSGMEAGYYAPTSVEDGYAKIGALKYNVMSVKQFKERAGTNTHIGDCSEQDVVMYRLTEGQGVPQAIGVISLATLIEMSGEQLRYYVSTIEREGCRC